MDYVDTHIHLQDYKLNLVQDIVNEAAKISVKRMFCVCSVEEDWKQVEYIAEQYPQIVVPAFGIHPWYVDKITLGWQKRLRQCFMKWPQALVGECGLDGLKENMPQQKEVFASQIALAKEISRPVIVHAVKAVSLLQEFLPFMPKQFIIHSFNGKIQHLPPILKAGGYVSFSASILRNPQAKEIVNFIPENRLLIETDGPYQSISKGEEQTPKFLPILLEKIAVWRNQNPVSLSAQIFANSECLINGK